MNKLGYAMKEMIILSAILAIVFMIGIGRVSYAYEEADRSDEIANIEKSTASTEPRVLQFFLEPSPSLR